MLSGWGLALVLVACASASETQHLHPAAALQARDLTGCPTVEGADTVSLLQTQQRLGPDNARLSPRAATSEAEPEWRDAIEVITSRISALQAGKGSAGSTGAAAAVAASRKSVGDDMGGWCRRRRGSDFKEPAVLRSKNGLLEVTLTVEPGWIEFPELGIRALTRLYNGSYPGPTLMFKRGDRVKVRLINTLGPNSHEGERRYRRDGQATVDLPNIPLDFPTYQNVGQGLGNTSEDATLMVGHANNFHIPNTTNFHLHGLHVPCWEGQDEVLKTVVEPGQSRLYDYEISPYHMSGASWYHAHRHGSVTLQVGGGLVGALVVEDPPHSLPAYLSQAKTYVAVLHALNLGISGPGGDPRDTCLPRGGFNTFECLVWLQSSFYANMSGDDLWKVQYYKGFGFGDGERVPTSQFFTVNGQYQPTLKAQTGEWLRVRFLYASGGNFPVNMRLISQDGTEQFADGSNSGNCTIRLLSKDGVFVRPTPRQITKGLWLGPGQRAQVVMRCHEPGMYYFKNFMELYLPGNHPGWAQQLVMSLSVTGEAKSCIEPEQFEVDFPSYLQDLTQVPASQLATPTAPTMSTNAGGETTFPNHDSGQPIVVEPGFLEDDNKTIYMRFNVAASDPAAAAKMNQTQAFNSFYSEIALRFSINNLTFSMSGKDAFGQASVPMASVIRVHIDNVIGHSWHMHTHPTQIEAYGREDYHEVWGGFWENGDWADSIMLFDNLTYFDATAQFLDDPAAGAYLRFQTDCYKCPIVIHCHVLDHEDLGMMTVINVTGKQFVTNPEFKNTGLFASPPPQCLKKGNKCAPPVCTNFKYAS